MLSIILVASLVFIGIVGYQIAKRINLAVRQDREDRIVDDFSN